MSNQDNTELIEVVLSLLEKSKQQDESIQKAIETLENEKATLAMLKRAVPMAIGDMAAIQTKNALKEPLEDLTRRIQNLDIAADTVRQAKNAFNIRTAIFYFFALAVVTVVAGVTLWLMIPTRAEIERREAEIKRLDKIISNRQDLVQLKTTKCDGQVCVRVEHNRCNYNVGKGRNKENYCIAQLAIENLIK